MLPSPRNSLVLAVGAGLISAALVVAWAAYELSLGSGPRFDFAALFIFASLGLFAAPVLALLSLVWLRMYRVQTVPGRDRTRATLAVAATVAPAFIAVAWVGLGLIVAFLS